MQFTEDQQDAHRATFINDCRQHAWGAAANADFVAKQLDQLMAEYAKIKAEDDTLAAQIKEAEQALDYHTVDNRSKRKEKQERRNQIANILQALANNMGQGQKALEQLQASIQNNLALAAHAQEWSWQEIEPKSDDPEPQADN
jgi:hypothetical protein